MGRISREGAKIAGEHLERLGLLVRKKTRARRKAKPSPHHALSTDPASWRRVVAAYLQTLRQRHPADWIQRTTWPLMESDYYQKHLATVVRNVLHERGVEARRSVWPDEANAIFPPRHDKGAPFPRSLSLRLPVRGPDESLDVVIRKAILLSAEGRDSRRDEAERFVRDHYLHVEEPWVIRPLAALLATSPSASFRFLAPWQTYTPEYSMDHASGSGLGMIEHVLFRLVFDAVYDISLTRRPPFNSPVREAAVHPASIDSVPEGPPMLELLWSYNEYIHYRAGFDTEESIVGGSDEVEAEDFLELAKDPSANNFARILEGKTMPAVAPPLNPENAWARIRVGDLAELLPPRFRIRPGQSQWPTHEGTA